MSFQVAERHGVATPRLALKGQSRSALRRFANRVASEGFTVAEGWRPQPGYVYTTVRAISARINQNYDGWPGSELKESHHTFIGKPIFVNHANEDPDLARGVVVASRYIENGQDKFVEVVQEVDAQSFPKLAKEIIEGGMDSVSMGAEAGFTVCSACENVAHDDSDLCSHVKYHKGEKIRVAGKRDPVLVWESCHKLGFFELSYVFDPADETAVVSKVVHANDIEVNRRTASLPNWLPNESRQLMAKRRTAFGEIEAPESVDTLRPEEGTTDEDFHHYVESPPELSDPDLSATHRLDREQEENGQDGDRKVEDIEGRSPDQGGESGGDPEQLVEEFVDWCDQNKMPVDHDALDQWSGEVGAHPEEVDTIVQFLEEVNPEPADDQPPAQPLVPQMPQMPTAAMGNRQSRVKTDRNSTKGTSNMSFSPAQRGRTASAGRMHHFALEGGPYGENDQGEDDDDVYLTSTPPAEAVAVPDRGDSPMSNTENNLVAALQHSTRQTTALAQRLEAVRTRRAANEPGHAPDEFRKEPKKQVMPGHPDYDNQQDGYYQNDKRTGARYFVADGDDYGDIPETAEVVNPPLANGPDSVKGDDFESANPNPGPQTQPKDAAIHAFKAFDTWLATAQNKQRTASLYTNERFIVGQVKRWAKNTGHNPTVMFPVLASVLRDAKRIEERNAMRRQAQPTESLETAAPQDRIDVERPTTGADKPTATDGADEQGTYKLKDFADNAGDDIADPDLSTNLAADLEGWSGDKATVKSSAIKTADAGQAVRLAEAYIKAGMLADGDKWSAVAQFQKMRAGQVIDRTHLLEAAISNVIAPLQNKVASGSRRGTVPQGIPAGFGQGTRTASTYRTSQNDPSNDIELFL